MTSNMEQTQQRPTGDDGKSVHWYVFTKPMSRWFVVHEKKFQKQNHKLKCKQQLRLRAYVPRLQQRAPYRTDTLAFTHRMYKLSEEFPPL